MVVIEFTVSVEDSQMLQSSPREGVVYSGVGAEKPLS